MIYSHFANIAEICVQKNVLNFFISSGSRSAPLSLSFIRHSKTNCKMVIDERSSAYIALGLAQTIDQPVGLVCTSGTAVLNYAPAIAEAFFQKIPLLVFTADRPPELINQNDNQSIMQNDIYKNCLDSYQLPLELDKLENQNLFYRLISEAINKSINESGPVHINVPIREPFYPMKSEKFNYNKNVKLINSFPFESHLSNWSEIINHFSKFKKILVLAGQYKYNSDLSKSLRVLQKNKNIIFISDIASNIENETLFFPNSDLIFNIKNGLDDLKPDLLISFGGAIVSKSIKSFLKKSNIKEHWHIQEIGYIPDTYNSLTHKIKVKPEYFFSKLSKSANLKNNEQYYSLFQDKQKLVFDKLNYFLEKSEFTEFKAIYKVLKVLPKNSFLQIGNSMPIRYVNCISSNKLTLNKNIIINSNRGTSGIDGSVSTALGNALATDSIVTLIIGDLSFIYDHNALWNNFLPNNLRVIVLNNNGGGIFKMLEESANLPEVDSFFVSENNFSIQKIVSAFNVDYIDSNDETILDIHLNSFFESSNKAKILEITTDIDINTKSFKEFKKLIAKL